jgi:multiple sugar transport system permease protein
MRRPGPLQWLMVLPVQSLVILVIALPSLWVLWLSLNEATYGQANQFVGLENYATLLTDRYFWRAFVNTFIVVNVIVYLELGLALALATLFAAGIPWRPVVLAIVLMPFAVSEVVAVIIWRFLMDPEVGAFTRPLTDLGLPYFDWAIEPAHGLALVCLISVWLHLPFTFLIVYAARLTVPDELYEAARIDGATAWQTFRRVTFPMLIPAMLVALVFRYIFAFRLFSEVWLLTQGGPARLTEVLAVYLYKQSFTYNQFGLASAAGWVMVVLSGLIAALYMRLIYRNMFASEAAR